MFKLYRVLMQICIMLSLSIAAFAQQSKDYSILLNSGKLMPVENSKSLKNADAIFQKSLFGNMHYLVIQFKSLPTEQEKKELLGNGIKLLDYLPNNAYTASISQNAAKNSMNNTNIRSIFQLSDGQKTMAPFLKGKFPAHAVKASGTVDLTITTYDKLSLKEVEAAFKKLSIKVLADLPMFKNFTIRIPQQNFKKLLALSFVQWVEVIDPPNVLENLLGRSLHRVNVLNDGVRNLKGTNINIGIWDGGDVDSHIDFSPTATRINLMEPGAVSDHGTHCTGTIGGGGLLNPKARGMAPKAKIFSWNFGGNIPAEQAVGIPANNLAVSSHSYGGTATCGLAGASVAYSSTSRNTDLNLNNFPNHLHVHSAGNSQTSCAGGWSTITGSGKTSKNNILVANITSAESLSGSSSCGPVLDGRVKPEISAFGTNVLSTVLSNNYALFSGTSMAAPGVAGSVALLVERYRQLNANANPISTLIKNSVLNTAQDLGNIGPDYRFGYGRLNALAAIKILEQNRYAINTITTSATNDITVTVPAGTSKLRIMLTWNDPAGTANASVALVNNLDLSVIIGATTTLPWILDPNNPATPATKAIDNVSNIEQVEINNPAAGTYTLRVVGAAIPSGPQQYALSWNIDQPGIEVIFPNGAESFTPGVAETITWDNAGLTSTQSIDYSLNNGGNWISIATGVSASTTRLSWTPPAGSNTSTALVRVSSGGFTDVSDATFNILSTPSNLAGSAASTCTAGSVNLTWTAVPEANNYDILWLNETTGSWIVIGNSITGTSYTATGFAAGATIRFGIIARNTNTNAVSERSIAIAATTSTSGLGAISNITGNTLICGVTNNVSYNLPFVAGATTYTWTVPTGATIASGQGTNNVTVNYGASSTNGNVSVFASTTGCQTTTATLAITVGANGSSVPPTSGGNQSVTHCAPNAIPTITATASTIVGNTVVWYNAATAGTIVTTPSLNTIGTVTYYAASRNIATGCESATRTAVSLTITSSPAPTASAASSTTFCTGGSVVLTATAGLSYTWSNGATTQSITVGTAGNYNVIVNQAGGCVGTSNTIPVVVNALPTIGITSSGSNTFCQGNNVTLTATAGNGYTWSNGATTQAITVSNAGSYSVNVNQGNACINNSPATVVTVNPLPLATISAAGPTSFCDGNSVVLAASTGSSYLWSNGATTTNLTANTSGNYSVKVTDANGCFATSSPINVVVTAKPLVSIVAQPYINLFPGLNTSLTATASAAVNYTWFKNGVALTAATNAQLPVSFSNKGNYYVQVTNASGCSNNSNTINVGDSATAALYIYPNPNNGQFQLNYFNTSVSKNTITIFDAKGSRVYSKTFETTIGYQLININMYKPGTGNYNIVLSDVSGKKIAQGRIVVM
jgi:Subtilase family/PKD-like domain/Ig-like domain CHU_C associated/Secretion system C-terminal sorting domain